MDNELDALLEVTKIQKELVNKAIEEGITIPFKKLFGVPK